MYLSTIIKIIIGEKHATVVLWNLLYNSINRQRLAGVPAPVAWNCVCLRTCTRATLRMRSNTQRVRLITLVPQTHAFTRK